MSQPKFSFRSKLWVYPGPAAWYFLTLPKALSATIKKLFGANRPGFGSIAVTASIGSTTWKTSIFPSTKERAYLLPVKASVRTGESLKTGSMINVHLAIRDV